MTEPIDGAEERFPFLRDLDGYFYVRHHGGPLGGRGVRAEGQAQGARRRADRRVRRVRSRTGITSRRCSPPRASGCRRCATPASSTTCGRPRASRPTPTSSSGEFPEVKDLFVAAGLNSQGIIYGPGRRAGARGVDRRGSPDEGPDRGRHRAHGSLGEQPAWLHDKTHGNPRAAVRDALARAAVRVRTWGAPLAAAAAAASGRCRRRRSRRLGSRRLVRARRSGRAAVDLRLRSPVVVRARRRGDARHARTAWPSSTSRRTRSSWCRDPRRWRACNTCARRTSTSRSGASCTRCCATSAVGSRWIRRSRGSTRIGTSCSRPRCTNGGPRCCCATGCRRARP